MDSTGWAHGLIKRRHEMGKEMCCGRELEKGCTGREDNQEALYTCVRFSKEKIKKEELREKERLDDLMLTQS